MLISAKSPHPTTWKTQYFVLPIRITNKAKQTILRQLAVNIPVEDKFYKWEIKCTKLSKPPIF